MEDLGSDDLLGVEMKGATLGLVGFGRIGKAMARRAIGFDMRVIYYDPSEKKPDPDIKATRVDFETLLEESDFISLHTPLTPDTRHLIDSEALSKMKPNAVLVNTSRGPVVDPDALYEALKENRIFGAGLDVTEPEPLPLDSPLLTLDNMVIVPHIASASKTARDKMSWMAAKNLIAGLKGERLPNCVNPQVYLQLRFHRTQQSPCTCLNAKVQGSFLFQRSEDNNSVPVRLWRDYVPSLVSPCSGIEVSICIVARAATEEVSIGAAGQRVITGVTATRCRCHVPPLSTSLPARPSSVSSLSPPLRVSFLVPPQSRSLPPRPLSVSLPSRPRIRSAPEVPLSAVLLPLVPTITVIVIEAVLTCHRSR